MKIVEIFSSSFSFYANQTLDETNAFVSLTPSSGALAASKTNEHWSLNLNFKSIRKNVESRSNENVVVTQWNTEKCNTTNGSITKRNASAESDEKRFRFFSSKYFQFELFLSMKTEVSYKVSIQPSSEQEEAIDDDSSFYLILHGQDETSPKFLLKDGLITDKKHALKKDSKIEFEFKCLDLGKVRCCSFRFSSLIDSFFVFFLGEKTRFGTRRRNEMARRICDRQTQFRNDDVKTFFFCFSFLFFIKIFLLDSTPRKSSNLIHRSN